MHQAQDIIIGAVILLLVARRQLTPRPLSGTLLILPAALTAFAVYEAVGNTTVDAVGWISLLLTLALSFGIGTVRGRLTRVYQDNGRWMVSGSWTSLLLWLVSIPIRYGLEFLLVPLFGSGAHFGGSSADLPYLFSIAGLLLGKAVVIALRNPQATREARAQRQDRRGSRRA